MMSGRVFNKRPTVNITIHGPDGQQAQVETVIDTGFTGFFALPTEAIEALALTFLNFHSAILADGSRVRLKVHEAEIDWHGRRRTVFVLATGVEALLGMSLLDGSRLDMETKDNGAVKLTELEQKKRGR